MEKDFIKIKDFYFAINNKKSDKEVTFVDIYMKENNDTYTKVFNMPFRSTYSLEDIKSELLSFMYEEIGKINKNGTIEKGRTEQGYVYKSYEKFFKREGICYIPEYGKSLKDGVTFKDIVDEVKNYLKDSNINLEKVPQEEIENMAFDVFDTVDWQCTDTLISDDWLGGWIENAPDGYFLNSNIQTTQAEEEGDVEI